MTSIGTANARPLTPLDVLLSVMRDGAQPAALRVEAAKSAAPYCHRSLGSIRRSGRENKGARPHSEPVDAVASDTSDQVAADAPRTETLTAAQEHFCQILATGGSAAEAHRIAYPNGSVNLASNKANALRKLAKIVRRLDELRQKREPDLNRNGHGAMQQGPVASAGMAVREAAQ
jgi:hypothetical protein